MVKKRKTDDELLVAMRELCEYANEPVQDDAHASELRQKVMDLMMKAYQPNLNKLKIAIDLERNRNLN